MRRSLLAMVVMSVIPLGVATAWPTVDLVVPPDLADVYNWRVNINSDSAYTGVWLAGWVRADGALVYTCTTHTFDLKRGTRSLCLRDVRIRAQWSAEGYKAFMFRSGRLPAASYLYGVTLLPLAVGDTDGPTPVRPMGPPKPLVPKDGDTVKVENPQLTWVPATGVPPGLVTYEVKLYQVLAGQTKEEAAASNPPYYEVKGLKATSHVYQKSARALPDTGEFVWNVTAQDANGVAVTSENRTFRMFKGGAVTCAPWFTHATIVWQRQPPGTQGWEIWFSDFSSYYNTPLVSGPHLLCPMAGSNMDPAVTYDRAGNTWCVWSHRDPGPGQSYRIVWSQRLTGQGSWSWSAPQAIAMPPPGIHQVDPVIAFDDDGRGFCAWVSGQITLTSDVMRLEASYWNGSNWTPPSQLGPNNPCRLPEITFTAAAVSGQTDRQAVVIAALQTPPDRVGAWTWDGSQWSGCNVLPTTGFVVSIPYSGYIAAIPTPAKNHITIAPLFLYNQPIVTAAWTRKDASATTKLMACNGYFNTGTGVWTWTEFPNWFNGPNGTSYHDPAVAVDASTRSQNVFVQSDRIFTKYGFGPCQMLTPPPTGRGGFRPGVAWVKGQDPGHSGPLAVWWYGPDIRWAFKNSSGVWNDPLPIVTDGPDRNPDVGAKCGSHTMMVQ